jgi:hypothetical protein
LKLGRGQKGSVFLCTHILDGNGSLAPSISPLLSFFLACILMFCVFSFVVALGDYAIKKVCFNSYSDWLVCDVLACCPDSYLGGPTNTL